MPWVYHWGGRAGMGVTMTINLGSPWGVKKSELEFALWGDSPPGSDALRSHLYTLRQKIDKPYAVPMIETLHGIGIRLNGGSH